MYARRLSPTVFVSVHVPILQSFTSSGLVLFLCSSFVSLYSYSNSLQACLVVCKTLSIIIPYQAATSEIIGKFCAYHDSFIIKTFRSYPSRTNSWPMLCNSFKKSAMTWSEPLSRFQLFLQVRAYRQLASFGKLSTVIIPSLLACLYRPLMPKLCTLCGHLSYIHLVGRFLCWKVTGTS